MKIYNHTGDLVETRVAVQKPHPASVHHVSAEVAELHEQRRQEGVRANHILHLGEHLPVNDRFHAANTAPWPWLAGLSRHELRAAQDDLLDKSNEVILSQDELAYLRAANNHFDVRTAVNLLGGRSHTEFGFDGVDQLHMNSATYPCGCKLLIVFDHHKRDQDHEHHKHVPQRVCDAHAEHAHDLDQLHARVYADNRPADGE